MIRHIGWSSEFHKNTGEGQLARKYINTYFKGKKILVINHRLDQRYSESSISTHSNMILECLSLEKLKDIKQNENFLKEYESCEVLVIEEAQFFNGLS